MLYANTGLDTESPINSTGDVNINACTSFAQTDVGPHAPHSKDEMPNDAVLHGGIHLVPPCSMGPHSPPTVEETLNRDVADDAIGSLPQRGVRPHTHPLEGEEPNGNEINGGPDFMTLIGERPHTYNTEGKGETKLTPTLIRMHGLNKRKRTAQSVYVASTSSEECSMSK